MSISPRAAVLLASGSDAASRGSLAADGLYKALTSNLNDSQTYPTFPPLLAFSISRDKGDGASNVRRLLGTVRFSVQSFAFYTAPPGNSEAVRADVSIIPPQIRWSESGGPYFCASYKTGGRLHACTNVGVHAYTDRAHNRGTPCLR